MKRFYSLGLILFASLFLPNCAMDQEFEYYENYQSSRSDAAFVQSKSNIRQSHVNTLNRLRERQRRLRQASVGGRRSNTVVYTTTTTNRTVARPFRHLEVQNESTYIATPNLIGRGAPNVGTNIDRSNNLLATLGLEVAEYERAMSLSNANGYDKYQTIKVKLFPIEKIRGRAYAPYPWVHEQNFRDVTLENNNSFKVLEVNMSDGKVVKDFGLFQKIKFEFGMPLDQLSNQNKALLYRELSSPHPTLTIDLSTLANSEESSDPEYKTTSLVISPNEKPDDNAIEADGTRKSEEEYISAGFSVIRWDGIRRSNGSTPSEQSYFYRGDFEVAYAHRYRTVRDRRIWTIINLIDVEDYIYSVASKELGQAVISTEGAENARRAQVIASRTYTVLQADQARTGSIPRLWDLLPTTVNQAYLGVEAEKGPYREDVESTRYEILGTRSRGDKARLSSANYFGCTETRTLYPQGCQPSGRGCIPEQKPRIVPGTISCDYARRQLSTRRDFEGEVVAYGHGRGMCQLCALHLATTGWDDSTRRPSEDATYPENYNDSWDHENILKYFYDDSDIYKLTDSDLE